MTNNRPTHPTQPPKPTPALSRDQHEVLAVLAAALDAVAACEVGRLS